MEDTMPDSDVDAAEQEHTLIHISCEECKEVDGLTLLEHGKESVQVKAINEAHHTMAENHTDETGHEVEIDLITDSQAEIIHTAKDMADSVADVTPEDFDQDTINFV